MKHAPATVGCWLVAEAPSVTTIDSGCLTPSEFGTPNVANRLLTIAGWSIGEYLSVFQHRAYLWDHPTRLWLATGRTKAEKIMEESGDDKILVLGELTSRSFGMFDWEPFQWMGRLAFCPHPSGRCRYWKNPGAAETARSFFQALLTEARSSGPDRTA